MLAEVPGTASSREGTLGHQIQVDNGLRVRRATQSVLPLYRGQLSPVHAPRFAHPAEAQLAEVFSFYGIRWTYEPTTFALGWHADGQPSEMFTPDFYLPDHRLYIELTTMRQRLVTRKNRKVRMLTETYPNARVKLVYRRDFLRLIQTFRRSIASPGDAEIDVVWNEDVVTRRLAEVGDEIGGICATQETVPILLALGRGTTRFQAEVQATLAARGVPAEIDAIRLCRPRGASHPARARVCQVPLQLLRDRPVILLTDVVSTGMSLRYVQDWLSRRAVNVIHTCVLLDRASARLVDVRIDSAGFTAPKDVLAGFGLSLVPTFTRLPFIGTVRSMSGEAPVI